MSNKNTGGAAFPRPISVTHGACGEHQEISYPQDGMTLRDYFAARAMQGMLSNNDIIDYLYTERLKIIIEKAFLSADIALREREK